MAARTRRKLTSVRRRLPVFILAPVIVALCLAGVIYKGVEVTQVNVNDGGIWVTNRSRQLVGHLDYEARILDGALRTEATNFDIGQAGETVTVSDLTSQTIAPVNVTQVSLGSATMLPAGSIAVQGGDILGVLNPTDGTLWTTSALSPNAANLAEGAALASGLGTSALATGMDGSVYALSSSGTLTSVKQTGSVDQATTSKIEGIAEDARLSITVVGDQVVALDSASNTLFLPGNKRIDLSAAGVESGGVLQQAGPKDDSVLLATPSALVAVPLKGGAPVITPAAEGGLSGNPAAPVRHEGCAYGAWGASGAYIRSCVDPSANIQMIVDTLTSARDIVFRTNRKAIVLNDVAQGSVWLPDAKMVLMDNWDEVENQLEETEEEQDNPELTNEVADPQQREENTPPEAVDDEFGIRPGRSTILPVLDNDSDLDGDVLTAAPTSTPEWGTVMVARSGRALQITDVSPTQAGSASFSYEASDGQTSSSARVRVTIHPFGQNEAPVQLRASSLKLGVGAQIRYQALSDWRDPDGDLIYLKDAQAPEGLSVSFSEDGSLMLKEEGGSPGAKSVILTVADDQGGETRGELVVSVQEAGNQPPSANGDLFQAHPGEIVTLDPLKNDTDPNGDPLSLAAVSPAPAGTTITPDLERGTIDFRATDPGSYAFAYTISDGIDTTLGIIRVEVIAASALPPVAENDTAVLPQGGSVLVAPLGNDYDPSGGLLSITSVDATNAPGIDVALIDRHLLRVTAPSGLDSTVVFSYTVTNGQGVATADVMVIPGASDRSDLPPVLEPDRAKVRVGDVGTVSVLTNDRSPAGLNLQVESTLEYDQTSPVGTPFVTGNQVRLAAGTTPGVIEVTYSVIDSAGNRASSTVTFEVLEVTEQNQPPRPREIMAWAAAGQMTRIPVTVDGIDPDGDSVRLVGLGSSPQKGHATTKDTWIEYTPNQNANGTDSFTFKVEDRQGASATARIRVAVSPLLGLNQNPVAVPDTVLTRPNRMVTVNVLSNDMDPDGDPLTLDDNGLETVTPELDPQVHSSSSLQVRAPSEPGSYLVSYTVSDGRGGSARGTVTIYVQPDAPLKAPIARDDFVAYEDLPTDGSSVRVKVLDNDEDPDGAVTELKVSTSDAGISVNGSDLLIPVTDTLRLVVYTITDRDGLTNSAVVTVPGRDTTAPFLNTANLPIEMDAGTSRTISVGDYVFTRAGRSPRLVEGSSPISQEGLDSVVADSATQLTLTATATFGGNSAFLIQVADGDAADAGTITASLSLPVRIKPTVNQPPTFAPTAIRVEAGGPEVTQNLALGVSDPEGTDVTTFSYAMGGAPSGISASLSGSVLTVSAPDTATPGSVGAIPVTVTDEEGNTVSASIPVEIVATTKPRIEVPAYSLEGVVGQAVSVDVASRASNPFPDTPITLEGVAVSLGEAEISSSGTTVTIIPKASGTISVGYRVNDKLRDPSRVVQSTITVTVKGKPDAPSNLRATLTGGNAVTVTFNAPAAHGSPITGYRLYNSSGVKVADCSTTVCTVSDLQDGTSHTFTATAINAIGESEHSGPSNPVTLSSVPDRPSGVTTKAGERDITVSWVAPNGNGLPVDSYGVTATVGGGGEPVKAATQGDTSVKLTGLVPGKTYYITVVAHNAKGDSQPSLPVSATTTRRSPDRPVIVADKTVVQGATAELTLTWTLGSSGSSDWGETTVTVGTIEKTVPGGSTSAQLTVPSATQLDAYVKVTNRDGDSALSPVYKVSVPAPPPSIPDPEPQPQPQPDPQPRLMPLAIDEPNVQTPADNARGQLSVFNVRVKPGNGFTADKLEVLYSLQAGVCTTSENVVNINDGDKGHFNILNLTPGQRVTVYFCQRGVRADGSKAWGPIISASGIVGTGGGGGGDNGGGSDDDSDFHVDIINGTDAMSATWNRPKRIPGILKTIARIEGLDRTRRESQGFVSEFNASGLRPDTDYTLIIEFKGDDGRMRTFKRPFKTLQVPTDVTVLKGSYMPCSTGAPCQAMRLTANYAKRLPAGESLVCTVMTGNPARPTPFTFTRANYQVDDVLVDPNWLTDLNHVSPVRSCRQVAG